MVTGEIGANTINVGADRDDRAALRLRRAAGRAGDPAFTAGTTAVTVNPGQTQTLAPGDYGNVTVNGTLNLSGGTYEIQSLRVGPDGRLAANAASTVRVQTGIADQRSRRRGAERRAKRGRAAR